MRLSSFISFAGFVMLIAATYCPILRPFGLRSFDVFEVKQPYGIVILLVAVVGILGTVFSQIKITRLAAWLSFALVLLLFILAQLKIHSYFNFIPFHAISAFFTRKLKLSWGWYLLFAGPLLALAGVFGQKSPVFDKQAPL